MKKYIKAILLSFSCFTAFSQQGSSPINSFEIIYQKSNPTLIYSYDSIHQIHDYSNNWDLDDDSIKDEVSFIGTGGTHLYFYLRVKLSSEKKSREFDFIQSDMPILTSIDTLNFEKDKIGFVVAHLGSSSSPSIIVRLDESSFRINEKVLAKKKVYTKNMVLSFKKGKIIYNSF
ncbi:MAG: hypothetical protein U0U66_02870 [Cytophagaceae bacterium]